MHQLIDLDKKLFLFLNNLGSERWDGFWFLITDKYTWIPLYMILVFLLFKHFGWKQTILIIILVASMILCADQLTNLIKNTVKRLRPCHDTDIMMHVRYVRCGGRYGFTSSHASNHFALALFIGTLLYKRYKWLMPILFLWAALIAYSRIYVGVHFPLDITAGTLLGLLIGGLFLKLYKSRFIQSKILGL